LGHAQTDEKSAIAAFGEISLTRGFIMNYLPTAFANLEFAWKLLAYGEEPANKLQDLDIDIVFQDDAGRPFFSPPSQIFSSHDDLIIALQNNLTIAFGAAAITLHRAIEESGHKVPRGAFETEVDQCIALVYQVRNCFAHDIAEPKWEMRNPVFRRQYNVSGLAVDLSDLNEKPFSYDDFSLEALFILKDYTAHHLIKHERV
jgi:hypothetical protein